MFWSLCFAKREALSIRLDGCKNCGHDDESKDEHPAMVPFVFRLFVIVYSCFLCLCFLLLLLCYCLLFTVAVVVLLLLFVSVVVVVVVVVLVLVLLLVAAAVVWYYWLLPFL